MKIKAYLKPSCGWSNGVRAIMQKHNLAYEDIDIINNRANYAEMVEKSGQPLSHPRGRPFFCGGPEPAPPLSLSQH